MDKVLQQKVAQLEALLARQLGEHEQLLELIKHKRLGLRQANHRLVADCCRQENRRVQQIGELEKDRLRLAAELTLMLVPAATEPLRLGDLALHIGEPARGRLLVLRQQLLERMGQVREDAGGAQRAAEALARHMQGLVQTLSSVMSGGAAYSNRGGPTQTAMAMSTFNMTA
jgi:hypothetical protein